MKITYRRIIGGKGKKLGWGYILKNLDCRPKINLMYIKFTNNK